MLNKFANSVQHESMFQYIAWRSVYKIPLMSKTILCFCYIKKMWKSWIIKKKTTGSQEWQWAEVEGIQNKVCVRITVYSTIFSLFCNSNRIANFKFERFKNIQIRSFFFSFYLKAYANAITASLTNCNWSSKAVASFDNFSLVVHCLVYFLLYGVSELFG